MSLILALVLVAPQASATVPTQVAAATAPTAAPEEKLVCKRYAEVGSNIARTKKCLTRAQWDAVARQSQSTRRGMEQAWTTPNQ